MTLVEFIGYFSGFCTTVSFLPQVIKVWRTRSCKDISLSMYAILLTGVGVWIIYGWIIDAWPIMISNGVTFVLVAAVLTMKMAWGSPDASKKQ